MTDRVQWVTVVLVVAAHINLDLTELAFVGFPLARADVHHLHTVTLPFAHTLVTRRIVQARFACALVHIQITVAAEVASGALSHGALVGVLSDERGIVLRACVAAVRTDTVGEAVDAGASVGVR
jgi:hypothetical protein